MISEADAREAARHLAVCRERLSKLDKEDVEFKHVARDMDNHAWRLACFAVDELARREAERVEREKPIDAEWCVANEAVNVDGCSMFRWTVKVVRVDWDEYNGTTIDESDCNWVFLPSIKTRGQLFDLLAALKGGAT